MQQIVCCILLICGGFATNVYGSNDTYVFSSFAQQKQFERLTKELRCTVCQNQSIYDSMAPMAHEVRDHIYKMMQQHHSESEIIEFLTERFGEYVLYRPPVTEKTLLLWLGPLVLLGIGGGIFIQTLRAERKQVGSYKGAV